MSNLAFSRVQRDSTPRFVGPSVCCSVLPSNCPSHFTFYSRATRLYNPLCRSVGPSVRRSVRPSVGMSVCPSVRPSVRHTLLFLGSCGLWPYCSCPNDGVTSNMAPAHLHATSVASIWPCGHVLHDSTPRFVGLSVHWSYFTFLGFLRSLASLLLPK